MAAIDCSSSAYYAAREIVARGITASIITNSVPVMQMLSSSDANIELNGVGGRLRKLTLSLVGPAAVRMIRDHFETPAPAWEQEQTDAPINLLAHDRSPRAAHDGRRYLKMRHLRNNQRFWTAQKSGTRSRWRISKATSGARSGSSRRGRPARLCAAKLCVIYRCGSRSNAGMPSGTWWNGCLSTV